MIKLKIWKRERERGDRNEWEKRYEIHLSNDVWFVWSRGAATVSTQNFLRLFCQVPNSLEAWPLWIVFPSCFFFFFLALLPRCFFFFFYRSNLFHRPSESTKLKVSRSTSISRSGCNLSHDVSFFFFFFFSRILLVIFSQFIAILETRSFSSSNVRFFHSE